MPAASSAGSAPTPHRARCTSPSPGGCAGDRLRRSLSRGSDGRSFQDRTRPIHRAGRRRRFRTPDGARQSGRGDHAGPPDRKGCPRRRRLPSAQTGSRTSSARSSSSSAMCSTSSSTPARPAPDLGLAMDRRSFEEEFHVTTDQWDGRAGPDHPARRPAPFAIHGGVAAVGLARAAQRRRHRELLRQAPGVEIVKTIKPRRGPSACRPWR